MAIRVLVVEDSLTVRKYLVEVLQADPTFEVVGEGQTGRDAIEMTQRLRPDIVTIDIAMPELSGLAATEYLMAYCPTPILIVSASVNHAGALHTLDALAAGAVDTLEKPRGDETDERWERQFRAAVRVASRVKVITRSRSRLRLHAAATAAVAPVAPIALGDPLAPTGVGLIAIGASTGGPQALMEILPALPRNFATPLLLVVHLDLRFDASFREWLEGIARLPVRHVVDGEALPTRGTRGLLLAPADRHLLVERGHLRLLRTPERHSCRPSVDVLFESLAQELGSRAVGVLLTGMGVDGAAGLRQMRAAGALTIAQDEASSVIFGMPGEAIRLGAAVRILPLSAIAPALAALDAAAPSKNRA